MNPININFAPHIKAAFFDRTGGVSQGVYNTLNGGLSVNDRNDHVLENRKRIANYFYLEPQNLSFIHQIHSNIVINATTKNAPIKADAQITDEKNIILNIQTADCVPILCADPYNHIIAAIHAGWRGAFEDIIQNTIHEMIQKGANINHIQAAIGPCIHQKSYQVDHHFKQNFIRKSSHNEQFFIPSHQPNHYQFDLPNYTAHCLHHTGISKIYPSKWDTYSNEHRFFSHRRATLQGEKQTGRLVSSIVLI